MAKNKSIIYKLVMNVYYFILKKNSLKNIKYFRNLILAYFTYKNILYTIYYFC